jgi:hypothetical protein
MMQNRYSEKTFMKTVMATGVVVSILIIAAGKVVCKVIDAVTQ